MTLNASLATPVAVRAHAIRLALGSVDMDSLRQALVKVKRVVDFYA